MAASVKSEIIFPHMDRAADPRAAALAVNSTTAAAISSSFSSFRIRKKTCTQISVIHVPVCNKKENGRKSEELFYLAC